MGRGTNFVGSFGKTLRRVSATGGAGIPLNNYRTAVLKMQASNSTVEPSHETDLQVSSELGQIVTARTGESAGQANTMEITGTGKTSNISAFFTRWQLLTTGLLQTTDTSFSDLLGSAYYPINKYLNTTPVMDKTANYRYWEGDVEVLITVTPPSNAYGLYLVQAIPNYNFSPAGDCCNSATADNPWTATQGIHGFIDITTGNSVVLKLPYYNNGLGLSLPGTDAGIWRLCLWCISPIQNAVNADTIAATYNIYARMPDIQLMVPYYQSGKGGASSTLKRGLATAQKFKEDKTISKTAGKIASMAAMASTVPFLAPFAGPVAAGAASVMSMASMFGFTRESAPEKPIDVHQKSFSNVACVDGQDGSDVVALLQGNTLPIDPGVGGGPHSDEMAFASLFERWTIIDTFTWDTSAAALTDINTIPVSPFFGKQVLGAMYPTTCGFVGFPFKYWRGAMEYKLIIPSSVYHRGMLQVFWSPDSTPPATDVTQILLNEIFDVEANSEYTFSVDWSKAMNCFANTGFGSKLNGFDSTNCNGLLFFRVISQLQAVGGSAPITCCLLARAKDSMEFGVPREFGSLYYNGTVHPLSAVAQFQGKNVGDDEEEDSMTFELVPNMTRNVDRLGPSIFGEEIRSVRALVQKMSIIVRLSSGSDYNPTLAVPHFYPPPFTYAHAPVQIQQGVTTRPPWTWYGHYAAMYGCVRGSTRYKVWCSNDCLVQAFPVTADNYATAAANQTTFGSTGISAGFSGDVFCGVQKSGAGGTEFTLPGYPATQFRNPCDYSWTSSMAGSGERIDFINPMLLTFANQMMLQFVGAGPDISLFRFRRVPSMIVAT